MNFKVKTVVGGTYQRLKEKLQGLGKDVQAVDTSDLDYTVIKVRREGVRQIHRWLAGAGSTHH